jgi:hypothetical protein
VAAIPISDEQGLRAGDWLAAELEVARGQNFGSDYSVRYPAQILTRDPKTFGIRGDASNFFRAPFLSSFVVQYHC